jgi:HSP20 family protein
MFVLPVTRRSAELSRQVERLLQGGCEPASNTCSPAIDVAETEAAFVVTMDLPGVTKEDVQVSVEGRRLNVQAPVRASAASELLYSERSQARYVRTVQLPQSVDAAQTVAKLDNGVLVLTLAKPVTAQPARIVVN